MNEIKALSSGILESSYSDKNNNTAGILEDNPKRTRYLKEEREGGERTLVRIFGTKSFGATLERGTHPHFST